MDVDVLIVGARIAGSVLAIRLGGSGLRVLLVDRATFPSPTLSTHFFRGSGCAGVLADLGVLDEVLGWGAPKLVCEYDHDALAGTTDVSHEEDPGELGFNLSVRREPLDALLVRTAAACEGVEVRERTSLVELTAEDGRVDGARLTGPDGDLDVTARVVVGADGHASKVAALVGARDEIVEEPSRIMYYRYVRDMPGPNGAADGPEFSLGDDELLYAFPSDGDHTCVAVSMPIGAYPIVRRDPARAFAERLAAHPALGPRVAAAEPSGRLFGCGPRPSVVRQAWGPGWALAGDAGLYQDPWTGAGMDNASMHATYLADALLAWLAGSESEGPALARFVERRDADSMEGFRESVSFGRDLSRLRT
ncbi:MAG TPA: NAD(P)/FAD-dependent oxidoreductase [Actinomycetota bacterium]|nr:NAD(P)/FAD-dependent oxidoreductase [Actinomycetota bacterium]